MRGKRKFQDLKTLACKYEPDIHPKMLAEVLASGRSRLAFMSKARICPQTFYNWLRAYPEFNDTYVLGCVDRNVWWEEQGMAGLTTPGFNFQTWSSVMRNNFDFTEHRKVAIPGFDKCKTVDEQMILIRRAVAAGGLTVAEMKLLIDTIYTASKIDEHVQLKAELEQLKELVARQNATTTQE